MAGFDWLLFLGQRLTYLFNHVMNIAHCNWLAVFGSKVDVHQTRRERREQGRTSPSWKKNCALGIVCQYSFVNIGSISSILGDRIYSAAWPLSTDCIGVPSDRQFTSIDADFKSKQRRRHFDTPSRAVWTQCYYDERDTMCADLNRKTAE